MKHASEIARLNTLLGNVYSRLLPPGPERDEVLGLVDKAWERAVHHATGPDAEIDNCPKVYTSNYASLEKLKAAGLIDGAVPISRGLPRWFDEDIVVRRNLLLAPSQKLLSAAKRGEVDDAAYTRAFNSQLAHFSPHDVYHDLLKATGGTTPVLLCWEAPGAFCHRHLVAQWLSEAGIDAEEWKAPQAQGVLV